MASILNDSVTVTAAADGTFMASVERREAGVIEDAPSLERGKPAWGGAASTRYCFRNKAPGAFSAKSTPTCR